MADAVIAAASADCKIGAYFTVLDDTDRAHHRDCFRNQLAEMFQCGGAKYANSQDSNGQACVSLAEAHQNVDPQISQGDFDAFFIDATQALKTAGLSTEDLQKLGPILNSTQGDVVQNNDPTLGNSTCDAGPLEGGTEGGTDGGTDGGIADAPGEGG
jgi:hypothetical protein